MRAKLLLMWTTDNALPSTPSASCAARRVQIRGPGRSLAWLLGATTLLCCGRAAGAGEKQRAGGEQTAAQREGGHDEAHATGSTGAAPATKTGHPSDSDDAAARPAKPAAGEPTARLPAAKSHPRRPRPLDVEVHGQRRDHDAARHGRAGSRVGPRELLEQAPRSAPDALRYEPGVYVQQTAHGQASPFIRGRTGQQTLLLFDGVRLNNSTYRQGPNQYFFTVDAQSVHSIDVIRGGASTRYGSDAIGGVLDAHPREPRLTLATRRPVLHPRALFRAATADGEIGFRNELDVQLSRRLRTLVGVGSRQVGLLESGGEVTSALTGAPPEVPAYADDGRTQLGTGFREATADGRVVWDLDGHRRLVGAAYLYRQFDAPRTDKCPPPFAPRGECLKYDQQFRSLAYLAFEGPIDGTRLPARFTLSYQRQHEQRSYRRPAAFVENDGRDEVDTFGASSTLGSGRLPLGGPLVLSLQGGADSYFDRVASAAWTRFSDVDVVVAASRGQYIDGSHYWQGGSFADAELAIGDSLRLRAGGRIGGAYADAPGDPETGTRAVARGWPALVGHGGAELRLGRHIALLANADRSFRAPNLDDLTSRQQTGPGFQFENSTLEPESATTFEGGLRLDFDWLRAEAWGYHAMVAGAIERAERQAADCPTGTPQCAASWNRFQLVNLDGVATIDGFEAAARLWLPAGFSGRAALSYAIGEGPNPQDPPSDPTLAYQPTVPLSRVPPLNGSAELRWQSPVGAYLGGALRWALKQDRLAPSDLSDARIPAGGTPGFTVFDLRAGYRLRPYLLLAAVIENLGDAAFRYHGSSVDSPGRGLRLNIEGGM